MALALVSCSEQAPLCDYDPEAFFATDGYSLEPAGSSNKDTHQLPGIKDTHPLCENLLGVLISISLSSESEITARQDLI